MTVEDLIIQINNSACITGYWDKNTISSLTSQIYRGIGFTEKQSKLAISLLLKNQNNILKSLNIDVATILKNPTFHLPFRTVTTDKRIVAVDNDTFGKVANIIFPYEIEIIQKLKEFNNSIRKPYWDQTDKVWILPIDENSLKFLKELTIEFHFIVDDYIQDLFDQVTHIENNLENIVPMLVIQDNQPVLKNCSQFVPPIDTEHWLEALFEARKRGIFTWDNDLSEFVDSDIVDPISKTFLKSSPATSIKIDSKKYSIEKLTTIFKYLTPCLFVIPVSCELEKLEMVYNWLSDIGVHDDQMSVMFRLDSNVDKGFNEYVKQHNLNTPITEKTQAVFISGKLKKTIVASNIKFNSVIHLGYGMVHNTIKEYAGKHHNFIYFHEKTAKEELSFGNL